jgi:HEAT repeat protein
MTPLDRRRRVVVAGHRGDTELVMEHLADDDPGVREAALGALARIGSLTDAQVSAAFADPAPVVRRRAATLAATRRSVSLLSLLDDTDSTVVEVAAWACGEQERVDEATLTRLIALATDADDALVRESSAAALGAIGDPRGLPAILAAVRDKPNVRRRAVLALAPFEGPDVDAAIEAALIDRDWQVRQAAEDLRRATGELDV